MSVERREGRVATRRVTTDRKKMGENRGGGVEARRQGYEPQSRWRQVNGPAPHDVTQLVMDYIVSILSQTIFIPFLPTTHINSDC